MKPSYPHHQEHLAKCCTDDPPMVQLAVEPSNWSGPEDRPPHFVGVTRKINSEIVLVLAWGRAILLQLAHPLVAYGVAEHSPFSAGRWDQLRRLHRTVDAMLKASFGTAEDVAEVARRINTIHDRVHGHLREGVGRFAAGTGYSAHDPTLLRWVHATLVESHLLAYELYVGPLTPAEKDRYCAETSDMETVLGMPEGCLPRSAEELRRYIERMLVGGEIVVTPVARALAREVISPASLRIAGPLVWVIKLPTIGLLPPRIREAYRFPWTSRHEQALAQSARAIRALLRLLPSPFRHWPAARRRSGGDF